MKHDYRHCRWFYGGNCHRGRNNDMLCRELRANLAQTIYRTASRMKYCQDFEPFVRRQHCN